MDALKQGRRSLLLAIIVLLVFGLGIVGFEESLAKRDALLFHDLQQQGAGQEAYASRLPPPYDRFASSQRYCEQFALAWDSSGLVCLDKETGETSALGVVSILIRQRERLY